MKLFAQTIFGAQFLSIAFFEKIYGFMKISFDTLHPFPYIR